MKAAAGVGLVLCTLAGPALAQSPALTPKNPETFDILGVRPGMSPPEVEAAIKAANPLMKVVAVNGKSEIDGHQYVEFVTAAGNILMNTTPQTFDAISVRFTDSKDEAVLISRSRRYSLGQPPLKDDPLFDGFARAINAKYGKATSYENANGFLGAVYNYEPNGDLISHECGGLPFDPVSYLPNGTFPEPFPQISFNGGLLLKSPKCGVRLEIHAGSNAHNPALVEFFTETLVDNPRWMANEAAIRTVTDAIAAEKRKQQEGAKPPL